MERKNPREKNITHACTHTHTAHHPAAPNNHVDDKQKHRINKPKLIEFNVAYVNA